MAKIYQKDGQSISPHNSHVTELHPTAEEYRHGSEKLARDAVLEVRLNNKTRPIEGKFVRIDSGLLLKFGMLPEENSNRPMQNSAYAGNFPDWQTVQDQVKEIVNNKIREIFSTFRTLKQINLSQPQGTHKFNIPSTVRLMQNDNGLLSLLISDLTRGGENELFDLKYAGRYIFSKDTAAIIRETVEKDIELAEKHNIALSLSEIHPLDTWTLISNRKTKEKQVYILDTGEFVHTNANKKEIDFTRMTTERVLDNLRIR